MLNNILKVYGEDLVNGALNAATVAGDNAVKAGSTMGALCVNVFAKGDVDLKADVSVAIKHSDTENGTYASLLTISVATGKKFADGELMGTATLPQDVKAYVMGSVTSATTNVGGIRVTLGYLAR